MNATVRAVRPVLVGVDGSGRNASAVAWAAAEASSSGAPLVLVHEAAGAGAGAGRATVERAAAQVARVDGQLQPRTRVVSVGAGAVAALVQAARESGTPETGSQDGLVVVGRRGAGGFARMALGSTARRLVHDPEAPSVVVVPTAWDLAEVPAQAPVVVDASPEGPDTVFGVDVHDTEPVPHPAVASGATATATIATQAPTTSDRPSHGRQRALGAALARAQRDGRGVVAVSVWSAPADRADEGVSIAQVWAEAAAAAERDLETVLAPWRTAYPEVHIMSVATDRHPVAALLDHAQDADLLVVPRGARACAIAEYATCPLNIT